jgi:hypothetical protein
MFCSNGVLFNHESPRWGPDIRHQKHYARDCAYSGGQGCGKMQSAEEQRPLGLKPTMISRGLRGPEGPLFHGDPHIREFFRSL